MRLSRCLGVAVLATVVFVSSAALAQPRIGIDPQALQQPTRAPFTLTPTLTITEEFNDNVNLDNRNKVWDFITGITPGLALNLESSIYRLAVDYNFTAAIYAREPDRNAAFDRQNFALDGFYRLNPEVTLSLSDTFSFNTNTNLIAPEGVSTGRDRSWSNTLTPGVTWQINPLTAVRAFGSYSVQRFRRDDLEDSDVYRVDTSLERVLGPRFSGTIGYQFAYFDIQREETVTTHTPRIGGIYRVSPTITLSLSGGPTFEVRESDTRITPAVTATYRQRFAFGSVGASYDRFVGTAGGLGGTTDNQAVGVSVDVITLARGLTLSFAPRYTTEKSQDDSGRTNRIDVDSFALPLTATYRFTPWLAAVGSYQFFRQRSDSVIRTATFGNFLDADQNRVFIGLQFGYPIRFD